MTQPRLNVLGVDSCLVLVVGAVALVLAQLQGQHLDVPRQTVLPLSVYPPLLQALLLREEQLERVALNYGLELSLLVVFDGGVGRCLAVEYQLSLIHI